MALKECFNCLLSFFRVIYYKKKLAGYILIKCEMLNNNNKKNSCYHHSQNVCLSAGLQSLWTKFIFSLFTPHTLQITREILNISPGHTPTRTAWDRSTQSVCPLVTVSWEQPPCWKPPQTPKALKSKLCGPLFWCVKLFLSPCLLSAVCLLVFASLFFWRYLVFYARNKECCLLRPGTYTSDIPLTRPFASLWPSGQCWLTLALFDDVMVAAASSGWPVPVSNNPFIKAL